MTDLYRAVSTEYGSLIGQETAQHSESLVCINTTHSRPLNHTTLNIQTDNMSTTDANKPKKTVNHPTYAEMVASSIAMLKDRRGSSRQAITKHVCANYDVDAVRASFFIQKALKKGIEEGTFKKAKESGKGAGRYKLVLKKETTSKRTKPAVKKTTSKGTKPAPKMSTKPVAKKSSSKGAKGAKKSSTKRAKVAKKPSSKGAKQVAMKSPKGAKPGAMKSSKGAKPGAMKSPKGVKPAAMKSSKGAKTTKKSSFKGAKPAA